MSKYGMTGIYLRYLQTTNINFLKLPKVDIVREVRELFHHIWSTPHTISISQKQSYDFRFMVKIILIIPYASGTY